jgi:hypothetical protein
MEDNMIISIKPVTKPTNLPERHVTSIPVSTTFTGTIGGYTGLFLATWDNRVVYLNNPDRTWCGSGVVCDYEEVDVFITYNLKTR